ncbi:hypothetical protein KI387_021860 [Taxus chinensis]|uniref:Uncharacterized protein n=1 Tax=Taxus chinensis TaxID=29808 RepID=A0AA38LDY4_TAXCH|nr:hypothetical protein KI387_021860 [Taxus chinensis]
MASVLRKIISTRIASRISGKSSGFHEVTSAHENPRLSTEARKRLSVLQCESGRGICNVYLVGVHHLSSTCYRDVQQILRLLKPQNVFLELCKNRDPKTWPIRYKEMPRFFEIMEHFWVRKYNIYGLIRGLRYRMICKELEIEGGAEFRVAYEEAMKYGGNIILGDRSCNVTAQRVWAKMSVLEKTRYLFRHLRLFTLPSHKFKQVCLKWSREWENELMSDKRFHQIIVEERDEFMCAKLLKVASESKSVVAVVGLGMCLESLLFGGKLMLEAPILISAGSNPLHVDHKNGVYLLLTSEDVGMQNFYRAVCGFHYFTFPSIIGSTLPYAWVGKQCADVCTFPFVVSSYVVKTGFKVFRSPNDDIGVEGMVSVIGHELAELSSNPLMNAWYASEDPTSLTEIADLCVGVYGTGGKGDYAGQVLNDATGASYNLNGIRWKFLVLWIWNPTLNVCYGPNAIDN